MGSFGVGLGSRSGASFSPRTHPHTLPFADPHSFVSQPASLQSTASLNADIDTDNIDIVHTYSLGRETSIMHTHDRVRTVDWGSGGGGSDERHDDDYEEEPTMTTAGTHGKMTSSRSTNGSPMSHQLLHPGHDSIPIHTVVSDDQTVALTPISVPGSHHPLPTEKSSINSSVFVLSATTLGAGILALPNAFSQLGWILGGLMLLAVGLTTSYSIRLLLNTAHAVGATTYEDLGAVMYPRRGRTIVVATTLVLIFGSLTAFFVIIADTVTPAMQSLFGYEEAAAASSSTTHIPFLLRRAFVLSCVALCVVFPLCLLKSIHALEKCSFLAVGIILVFSLIVIVHAAEQLSDGTAGPDAEGKNPNVGRNVKPFNFGVTMFEALPVICLAFTCQTMVFPIWAALVGEEEADGDGEVTNSEDENDHQHQQKHGGPSSPHTSDLYDDAIIGHTQRSPQSDQHASSFPYGNPSCPIDGSSSTMVSVVQSSDTNGTCPPSNVPSDFQFGSTGLAPPTSMQKVVNRSLTLCATLYLPVGIFGFFCFGLNTNGDILNNFPSNNTFYDLVRLVFTLAICIHYPVVHFGFREAILNTWYPGVSGRRRTKIFYVITTSACLTSLVLALLLPNLSTVFQLTGALCAFPYCFMFPTLFYLRLHKHVEELVMLPGAAWARYKGVRVGMPTAAEAVVAVTGASTTTTSSKDDMHQHVGHINPTISTSNGSFDDRIPTTTSPNVSSSPNNVSSSVSVSGNGPVSASFVNEPKTAIRLDPPRFHRHRSRSNSSSSQDYHQLPHDHENETGGDHENSDGEYDEQSEGGVRYSPSSSPSSSPHSRQPHHHHLYPAISSSPSPSSPNSKPKKKKKTQRGYESIDNPSDTCGHMASSSRSTSVTPSTSSSSPMASSFLTGSTPRSPLLLSSTPMLTRSQSYPAYFLLGLASVFWIICIVVSFKSMIHEFQTEGI